MVEKALRKLAPLDPMLLGDPAEAEEFHLEVLASAATLDDVAPSEAGLEITELALL